jgi:hypothetical protein
MVVRGFNMKIRQYDPSRGPLVRLSTTKGSYGVIVFVRGVHIDKTDDDNKYTLPSILSVLLLVFN